jgi:hypothetical protein
MKSRAWVIGGVVCAFLGSGCANGGGEVGANNGFLPPQGTVVIGKSSVTLPTVNTWENTVSRLTAGTTLYALSCEKGFDLHLTPLQLTSAPYQESGDQLLSFQMPQSAYSGGGDSGTPIVSLQNDKAGQKYQIEGVVFAGFDRTTGYGRSISQLLKTLDFSGYKSAPISQSSRSSSRKLVSWNLSTGNPEVANKIMAFPKMARAREIWQSLHGSTRQSTPTRADFDERNYQPQAGHRYAFMLTYGPEISLYGYATLSYETGAGRFVATGHPIEGSGPSQFPIFAAYTDGRFEDGTVNAHPVGSKPWGALVYDGQYGSIIEPQAKVNTSPVVVTIKVDGKVVGDKITHQIAQMKSEYVEYLALPYALLIPISNRIDYRARLYQGTATLKITYDGADPEDNTFELINEDFDGNRTPMTVYELLSEINWQTPVKGKPVLSAELVVDIISVK